jgi:hypothetical protein
MSFWRVFNALLRHLAGHVRELPAIDLVLPFYWPT